jgi:RHS repeat-associated protein
LLCEAALDEKQENVGKLNPTNPLGAWKSIKVTKGDKVMATAKGFYVGNATTNNPMQVGAFVTAIPNQNTDPDSGNTPSVLSAGLTVINFGQSATPASGGVPKAYLRAVFYDNSPQHNYIRQQTASLNAGANIEQLLSLNFEAETDGLLQIFVANEANTEVFFDNVTMQITEDLIVQENHYYPFGMNMVGVEKQGMPDNKFQYNGKEKQEEFGLNWMDYGARFYDAQVGRWERIDPKADMYFGWSPYVYALNTPTNAIDPDGNLVVFINGNHYGNGGTEAYWRAYEKQTTYNPLRNPLHWGTITRESYAFDRAVMEQLHDKKAKYVDGSLGGLLLF